MPDLQQTIKSFTDLKAWQEAHRLAIQIYEASKSFPLSEQYGLTQQVRRAALSVSSNIAEGFSRGTYKEKIRFYEMAVGSLTEVQNQILFARDIGLLQEDSFNQLATQTIRTGKILRGLITASRGRTRNS